LKRVFSAFLHFPGLARLGVRTQLLRVGKDTAIYSPSSSTFAHGIKKL
jgi:hypothetical protein